ncbi:tyrocidine synthase, partial [Paenibacillus sp. A3]|uniref:non-ribosomal peptide synthetase n=1 Tax=Paenibacillus sp. A3 TaxID=1337054 RepID=UPI0006E70211
MENNGLIYDDAAGSGTYWTSLALDEIDRTGIRYDGFLGHSYQRESLTVSLEEGLADKLNSVTKNNDLLLYVIFLAALDIALYKYTGHEERIIGVPAYALGKGKQQALGPKVLPLKTSLRGELIVKQLLKETQQRLLDAYENQYADVEHILRQAHVCETVMDLTPVSLTMSRLHVRDDIDFICGSGKNELALCIDKDEDGSIEAAFVYNAGLLETETIRLFAAKYVEIVRQIITDPGQSVARLRLANEEETNRILIDFNRTKTQYSEQNKTLPELFEAQAEQTPDRIALRFGDRQLTYRELNEKSNAVARVLRANGVKPEAIVGVLLERSPEMAAGLLGILKAGGAYVPIDPKHPKERIEFILRETGAQQLLSTRSLTDGISFGGTLLDAADSSLFMGDGGKLDYVAKPHHLAYVVYTSGTTGNPKGVMVEHGTLSLTMLWERQEYGFTADDVSLVTTNYAFDGFITACFTPLISGSRVILTSDEESANPYRIAEYLKHGAVTYYTSVPAIYLTVLEYLDAENTKRLKAVTLVGEELPVKAVEHTRRLNPDIEIINRYGPSENTVDTTILRQVQSGGSGSGSIPIGKPVPNTKVFIVDKHHDLVPIGVPGELCIGGDRLARGYWKQPELTREKFIESPFEPGKKMYKTGDRAKWLPDGNIQFLGRIDNQVKVRGIRIELREIENRLLAHPDVREAVVRVRENERQENDLIVYFTGNPGMSASAVKAWLKKSLPDSMVPAHAIRLDRMPLTHNGKVNRRALPEPDLRGAREEEYAAPRNEIEALLAGVWSDVLGVERIGIDEDFFDLGGHSLKGTILIGKLHKQMNVKLALKDLFLHPTIRELGGYIEAGRDFGRDIAYEMIEPCEAQEWYETSSAQKRMFMVQQIEKGAAYNMPAICEVEGDFDAERIEAAFRALISRHESLRTSFDSRNGVIMQTIHDGLEFLMAIREENDRDIDTLIRDFVRPFELRRAPLFRAELVHSRSRTYLMVDMHHIVSDGVSVRLLMREFVKLYNGGQLEPLRIQYKDFAAWQNKLLQSESMGRQEAYWLERFKDELPALELPYDEARPAMQSFEGSRVSFTLHEAEAEQVRSIARETGSTTQMVLLSAIYILLAKYSGQEDIVIGSPIAGRSHPDLQGIMGMFVNTLALRNQVAGEKRYLSFLEEVKRNALEAYENESYPFEVLLDKVQVMRDTSRNPLFDVVFNMSHADDDGEAAIRGLRLTPISWESGQAKFDLTLNADENGRSIECSIEYSTKLFRADTIARMGRHYKQIVAQIGKDREVRLADIDLITEDEKREILFEFNATKRDYPKDRTIHSLFEEQAEKGPDRIAAVFGDRTITYRELNARGNQLAAVLRDKGVVADTVVGIMVERSIEMLIGILGILKAGGAYLPIDPDYPAERSDYMLKDCDARILLVSGEAGGNLRFAGERLDVAVSSETSGAGDALTNPDNTTSASHLAYVVYSSGSTGQPKGILAEHRNVVRLVKNTNYVEFREGDRILQTGALVFDATTFEVWGALLNGLTLHLVSNETILSPLALERELAENRIAILWLSVALFNQLAQEKPELFRPLTYLIVGGEVLSTKHINLVRSRCPGVHILNVYGPTENTT